MSLEFSGIAMDTRINGTLKTWNEERGFGFVTPLNGGQDIFLHISDYPKRGGPPKVGEAISFEIALNKDGKKKAIRAQRAGGGQTRAGRARNQAPVGQGNSLLGRLMGIALTVLIGTSAYMFLAPKFNRSSSTPDTLVSTPVAATPSRFSCDGRTHCSQMTSCEEATYFIRHCPNTQMDGDGDGIPCESQWCSR